MDDEREDDLAKGKEPSGRVPKHARRYERKGRGNGHSSAQIMGRCFGLPAKAGGLVALLCILYVFSQLLLIFDVESAFSLLAAGSAAVGACCLLARGARRLCRVVQSFTDAWTARWAATSTMSGIVDG